MRDVDDYCLNNDYTSNRWNVLSKWKCCLRESELAVKTQNKEKQEHEQKYKYFRTSIPYLYNTTNHLTI